MPKHILLAYATRAGSTAEVAAAIAESLKSRNLNVEVQPVKSNPSLDGVEAAILGSAIRMGSWLPEMLDFIKANQAALNAIPTALFTLHILNTGQDQASLAARNAYLNPVRLLLKPADEAFFSGKLTLESLSFVDRMMAKMVKPPIGDYRQWDQIRAWASTVLNETITRS